MDEKKYDVQSRLEEIDARVMAGLTPFQRATVEHIEQIFRNTVHRKKRVLVADEVGLGKTLIARGVISKIARLRAEEHDDLVKIAYICSNGAIAAQNIEKLAIDGDITLDSTGFSRLSMQHLVVARERGNEELKQRYIRITPLTPGTSFHVSRGKGAMLERSLMFSVLSYDSRFAEGSGRFQALCDLMWMKSWNSNKKNWDGSVAWAMNEVAEAREKDPHSGKLSGYPYDVLAKVEGELEDEGGTTFDSLARYLDEGKREKAAERKMVADMRRAFAKACVDMLEPDFVIMDEFQRFHELVADSDSETAMLAKRFFAGDTRVLLLSATPFRLFSTAAELDSGGFGDSYREFLEVMGFLNEQDSDTKLEFEEAWGSYTLSLQRLGSGACDIVSIRNAKTQAEESVRKTMARTERQSTGELGPIVDNFSNVRELEVSGADVKPYVRLRELAESAGIPKALIQADYVKSCPFPLSYMSRYKLMEKLKDAVREHPDIVRADKRYDDGLLWLRRWDVASYSNLNVGNARYRAFIKDLVGDSDSRLEQLLWVPPNRPYYRVRSASPFVQAEGFSKFLLFSAWSMVPPAVATLVSYEFERKNVLTLQKVTGRSYRYFKDEESTDGDEERDDQALPHRRMRFDREQRNAFLLLYPSRYLEGLVDVNELVNDDRTLYDFRRSVKAQIRKDLVRAFDVKRFPKPSEVSGRRSADWYIMALLKLDQTHGHDVMGELLDGSSSGGYRMEERYPAENRVLKKVADDFTDWNPTTLDGYPDDLLDVLADAAIGSAAVCAMRCYRGVYAQASAKLAFEFGHAFISRMNTASATLAVAAAMEKSGRHTIHWKNMLAYSCEGNMQAMVDEYAHVCRPVRSELSEEDIATKTHQAMVGDGENPNLHLAETRHGVHVPNRGNAEERIGTMLMRTNIAAAFMESKSSTKGDNVVSRVRLRNAFNSPFRPFVLVSTSVGQEGLDFHSYCRKICHWNLPSNPIDLEQREGRVNRYKGLAVRRSIAERYGKRRFEKGSIWAQMFAIAETEELLGEEGDSSGLLPFWGVTDGGPLAKVERYVYLYPFSRDGLRYARLKEDVFRFRAVMGMPDQEELLHMLEERIAAGDLTEEGFRSLFVNLCPFTWRR